MAKEDKPSHPGPKGSQGPLSVVINAANAASFAGYIRHIAGEIPNLGVDEELHGWPEFDLFFAQGRDCIDLIYRGAAGEPTEGSFYIAAEPGVKNKDLDDRLDAFLREHFFGDGGLDGNTSGSFGLTGEYDVHIVHYKPDALKGFSYTVNIAPHNIGIVGLGVVPRAEIEILQRLSSHNVLDLSPKYEGK